MKALQLEWAKNGIRYVTGDQLVMTLPRSKQGQLQGRPDCMFVTAEYILTVAQSPHCTKEYLGRCEQLYGKSPSGVLR